MLKYWTIAIMLCLLSGCSSSADSSVSGAAESAVTPLAEAADDGETGTLRFLANGEDFVRQGFTSKDGWAITFDHLYITLTDLTAYQTDPPYDATNGEEPEGVAQVADTGVFTVDLAEGDENADPIVVDTVVAPAGQYNALSWRIVPAPEGDAQGYTLLLDGTAEKEGETIDFTLRIDTEYAYTCGEYVGDERKGILEAGGEANLEATFHFDHIFGDGEAAPDDSLNVGALGFDPLAAAATDGTLDASLADLESAMPAEAFSQLQSTLETLGHVGEGHCYEASGGYTGE